MDIKPSIHAEGQNHRVAGGDYLENPVFHVTQVLRTIRPGLVPCPACELGLSPQATECPQCGHNFVAVARPATRRSRALARLLWATAAMMVFVFVNSYLNAFEIFGDALGYATLLLYSLIALGYLRLLWDHGR